MVILKAIGAFFVRIWRWIKETAWVQPLLIVGAIFAVIFSIPYITSWASEWSGNAEGAFFADSRQSLEGETDSIDTSNSAADRITRVIEKNMFTAKTYEEVDTASYGKKFYLVYNAENSAASTTAEEAFRELSDNWGTTSFTPSDKGDFRIYTIYASEESSNDEDYEITTNGSTAFSRYLGIHTELFNQVGPELAEAPYRERAGLDETNYVNFALNNADTPIESFPTPSILLVDFSEEAWDAGRFGMSEVLFSLSGSTARENASTLIDMWNHLDPYSEDNLFTLRD